MFRIDKTRKYFVRPRDLIMLYQQNAVERGRIPLLRARMKEFRPDWWKTRTVVQRRGVITRVLLLRALTDYSKRIQWVPPGKEKSGRKRGLGPAPPWGREEEFKERFLRVFGRTFTDVCRDAGICPNGVSLNFRQRRGRTTVKWVDEFARKTKLDRVKVFALVLGEELLDDREDEGGPEEVDGDVRDDVGVQG